MDYQAVKNRLAEVIKLDVVASRDPDFLATHVPFTRLKYVPSGSLNDTGRDITEEELYQNFVVNPANRHQFVIIHGPNGAGKSHLIRWLKVRLENDENRFNPEKELIIFIQRSNNTLRGTIAQLVETGIIKDQEQLRKYKYLLEAEEVVNEERLKAIALDHLVYEIERDESDKYFRSGERKELCVFLRNDIIRENLMAPFGPITRICNYISMSNKENTDKEEPLFKAEDFDFVKPLLLQLREFADRKASRFADRLFTSEDNATKEKLAKYLNSFTENVIRSCARYESGDLRKIFETLRKELYAQGKNLTLFIEDITAFTGIDKDLITVLVTEHGGMNEGSGICRISSFVGITTVYYEQFRDNFKDRVTAQIEVAENVFGDTESLCQLAGKYLNAIYQPYELFEAWADRGAFPESLPLFESNEYKDWEYVKTENGRKLTLFPFTCNALTKLYNALERKTPRDFLRKVIRDQLACYLNDPSQFPSLDVLPRSGTGLIIWKESSHALNLENLNLPVETKKRLEALICIWGEGTLFYDSSGTKVFVGGLDSTVFQAFQLPDLTKVDNLPSKTGSQDKKVKLPVTTIGLKQEEIRIPVQNPKEKECQEMIANVEKWFNENETLRSFERLRNILRQYLLTAINWQTEGVSYHIAKNMLPHRMIDIEGQAQGKDKCMVTLKRTPENRVLLIGLLKWYYLGDSSWGFPDAHTYQYYLVQWTYNVKDIFITALKGDDTQWPIFEWACVVEYYRLLSGGLISGKESADELAKAFLSYEEPRFAPSENGHCQAWKDMMTRFATDEGFKRNRLLLREFYNTKMGLITEDSDKFYIFYHKVILAIEKLKEQNFQLNKLPLPSPSNNVINLSLQLLHDILPKLRKIVYSELEEAKGMLEKMTVHFGNDITIDTLRKAVQKIKEYIDRCASRNILINSTYREHANSVLQRSKKIIEAFERVKALSNCEPDLDLLLEFADDPLSLIKDTVSIAEKLDEHSGRVCKEYNEKIREVSKDEMPDFEEVLAAAKQKISEVIANLEKMRGGSLPNASR